MPWIPVGEPRVGPPGTVDLASVTSLPAGSSPTAAVSGPPSARKLDLGIPIVPGGLNTAELVEFNAMGVKVNQTIPNIGSAFVISDSEPTETTRHGVPLVWLRPVTGPIIPLEPVTDFHNGRITLPATTGVRYRVAGTVSTGTVTLSSLPRTVAVVAEAKPGYEFVSGSTVSWSYRFTVPTYTDTFTQTDATKLTGLPFADSGINWLAPLGAMTPFDNTTSGLEVRDNRAALRLAANGGSHNRLILPWTNYRVTFAYKISDTNPLNADQVGINVRGNTTTGGTTGVTFRLRVSGTGAGQFVIITQTDGVEAELKLTEPIPRTGFASVSVIGDQIEFETQGTRRRVTYTQNATSAMVRPMVYASTAANTNPAAAAWIDDFRVTPL